MLLQLVDSGDIHDLGYLNMRLRGRVPGEIMFERSD